MLMSYVQSIIVDWITNDTNTTFKKKENNANLDLLYLLEIFLWKIEAH